MPSQTPENISIQSPHRSRDSNWNCKEQQLFRCEFTFFASIKIYFLSLLHTFNPVKRALCDDFGNFHTIWTLELRLYYFSDMREFTLKLTIGMFAVDSSQVREIAVCYDVLFFYYFSFLLLRWWLRMRSWIESERKFLRRVWQGRMKWATRMWRKWVIEGMTCRGDDWLR